MQFPNERIPTRHNGVFSNLTLLTRLTSVLQEILDNSTVFFIIVGFYKGEGRKWQEYDFTFLMGEKNRTQER
jgi:hypothetical protein